MRSNEKWQPKDCHYRYIKKFLVDILLENVGKFFFKFI